MKRKPNIETINLITNMPLPKAAWSSTCKTLAIMMEHFGVKKTTISVKGGKIKVVAIDCSGRKL